MSTREKLNYFIAALDFYLIEGLQPEDALKQTVIDYAYVYHHDDGRLPIGRASELMLQHLSKTKSGNDGQSTT